MVLQHFKSFSSIDLEGIDKGIKHLEV